MMRQCIVYTSKTKDQTSRLDRAKNGESCLSQVMLVSTESMYAEKNSSVDRTIVNCRGRQYKPRKHF